MSPEFEHEYVLGFVFQDGGLWLIRKAKPAWQRGKLNGIGGKLEPDEDVTKAMRREFHEETGVDIPEDHWRLFGCLTTIRPGVARVWLFTAKLAPYAPRPRTRETEEVRIYDPVQLPSHVHDNLRWMVPMAMADSPVRAEIREVEVRPNPL